MKSKENLFTKAQESFLQGVLFRLESLHQVLG